MTRYVRFKYVKRILQWTLYPATCPLNSKPFPGKGPSLKLGSRWLNAINAWNTDHAVKYLLKPHSGWVNAIADDGTPIAECLTMAGNIAEAAEFSDGFVRVVSAQPNDPIPDPANPLLAHRFTAMSATGQIRLPGDGIVATFPFLLAVDGWISLRAVEVFENMPEPIWPGVQPDSVVGYAAVVMRGAVIRQAPDGAKIARLEQDTPYRVLAEVQGWAKVGDKRWVDLGWVRRV